MKNNVIPKRLKGYYIAPTLSRKRLKGFALIDTIIAIVLFAIISITGISAYSSYINKAKVSVILNDFTSLKTTCSQMLYERAGLGRIDSKDFYKYFNQNFDSDSWLDSDNKTLGKSDPWDAPYEVEFSQVSPSESKITISSVGRYNKPGYVLLLHYKNGEVRTGTAGMDNDEGKENSDAAVVDNKASITTLWAN